MKLDISTRGGSGQQESDCACVDCWNARQFVRYAARKDAATMMAAAANDNGTGGPRGRGERAVA